METGAPHGLLPRHLPLLPAPDLRGLALQRLHDGPRPLEGGVRRDPRLDRRGVRDRPRRSRHPLLLDRVQEDPPPLLHRRLRRLGGASIPSSEGLLRASPARPSRRRQLAGAGDAPDRPRADLRRPRRGLRAGRRRRQPLPRLGRLLGTADPRPRRARRRRGGDRGGPARHQLRRRHRGRGRAGRGGRGSRSLGGDGADDQLRDRGGDERGAPRPRDHRPRGGGQVRRRLPRPLRRPARRLRLRAGDARRPRQPGRHRGAGGRHGGGSLERPRRGLRGRSPSTRSRRCSPSRSPPTWAWSRPPTASSSSSARRPAPPAPCSSSTR